MYKITKVVTSDGMEFRCEKAARDHLDNMYEGVVSQLALAVRGNYNAVKLKLILDENIDLLEKIVRLKKEMEEEVCEEE